MATRIRSRLREHIYRLSLEQELLGKPRITQTEIAEATGLTQTTVSMWMNVQKPLSRIDTEAWMALANYVGVSPEELLAFEETGEEIKSLSHHKTAEYSTAPVMG